MHKMIALVYQHGGTSKVLEGREIDEITHRDGYEKHLQIKCDTLNLTGIMDGQFNVCICTADGTPSVNVSLGFMYSNS